MILENLFQKKGQIGETLTWIVATLIIIAILIFFIFGSSLLGSTKKVGSFKESLTSKETFEGTDIFLKKSLFSYISLSSNSRKSFLEEKLKEMDDNGDFEISYAETRKEILMNYNKR